MLPEQLIKEIIKLDDLNEWLNDDWLKGRKMNFY